MIASVHIGQEGLARCSQLPSLRNAIVLLLKCSQHRVAGMAHGYTIHIHTNIHTYLRIYERLLTYIHAYIHTCLHTYMHTEFINVEIVDVLTSSKSKWGSSLSCCLYVSRMLRELSGHRWYTHTYIHTYLIKIILTYIYTQCIQTFYCHKIYMYIHTYKQTYAHEVLNTYIHT